MVAALAVVLAHNIWSGGALPVVVTLVGWISLVKGLVFLLLPPETSLAYFEALRCGQLFYAYMTVTLVIGIYLTFAYSQRGWTANECDHCQKYRRLILHEENWFPLIRPLDTFDAVSNAVGG
jgi:hypothetical protein